MHCNFLWLILLSGLVVTLFFSFAPFLQLDKEPTSKLFLRANWSRKETEKALYINSVAFFTCDEGTKIDAVFGDDFCDCLDGSDEISTNACSHRLAHQKAFKCDIYDIQSIFTSRVNDYICDCEDGSDEYETFVDCRKAPKHKIKISSWFHLSI